MTDSGVLELAQRAVMISLMVCAPALGLGMIVGLTVSVFQAATQIQESTLTFVPKILAVVVAMVVFGPWMLKSMVNFTTKLFVSLPNLVH
ncbi:MAG: flagellar biosynthesis protein FliQ [Armatimonadota bacterium]|nr:flagellar biosynthesis protein FliQ [bacterium]